jgi:hypothetical protein
MTHTLIIKTDNESDFELIKELAERLGLTTTEQSAETELERQRATFRELFGTWEGKESGEELAALIHNARHDREEDIEL